MQYKSTPTFPQSSQKRKTLLFQVTTKARIFKKKLNSKLFYTLVSGV
jgi:hypothetical protein